MELIRNPQHIPIPLLPSVVWYEGLQYDICPHFVPNKRLQQITLELEKLSSTPEAIVRFSELCSELDDYGYWFILGTLWVLYTGFSELSLWKKLFRAQRPFRRECLMKPIELEYFKKLPLHVACFRVHRPAERDWISYTLDAVTAGCIGVRRGVSDVHEYRIKRSDILALFLRRGEYEVLCLDRRKARFVNFVPIKNMEEYVNDCR